MIRNGGSCNITGMQKAPEEQADLARMAAYRAGDTKAGKDLYWRHFGRIRRYFANKACQQADVEDLVGRTFEILFAPETKIAGAANFSAYVMGIARNVWFRYLRDRNRHAWIDMPSSADPEALERYQVEHGVSLRALGAGKTTIIELDERLRKLLDALRELPAIYQDVLELYYWEEMTFEELAPLLGVPVGTAKSRLRLVKVRLYETIEGISPVGDERRSDQVITQVDEWARKVAGRIRRAIPA